MGGIRREDWPKRTKASHFNDADLAYIKECFERQAPRHEVARKLGCSLRSITKHYSILRGKPNGEARKSANGAYHRAAPKKSTRTPHHRGKYRAPEPERKTLPDRFYHSNFEPS